MINRNTIAFSIAAAAAATSLGCGSADTAQDEATGRVTSADTYGGPDLLWQDLQTGDVAAWVISGSTVTGNQTLTGVCGPSNGCSDTWRSIDTNANTILWWNPSTGTVQDWVFTSTGATSSDPPLSWQCGTTGNCSTEWTPIGRTQSAGVPTQGSIFTAPQFGLLWYNKGTGQVGVWQLSGSTVTGSQDLSSPWVCAGACAAAWTPVLTADFNGDTNTDILWWNKGTGQLGAWLLGSDGVTVTGVQWLTESCSTASGCATGFSIIGAADVNADGHVDLTWLDATTGNVASWLLDGSGNTIGTLTLNETCDSACSARFKPLGYVDFPNLPPPIPK